MPPDTHQLKLVANGEPAEDRLNRGGEAELPPSRRGAHPEGYGNVRTRRTSPSFVLLFALAANPVWAEPAPDPVLAAFRARFAHSEKNLPAIAKASNAAAKRVTAHPEALINVPYGKQPSFAEEVLNRSGGLANALPSLERRKQLTPHDIMLVSVRSWEQDRDKMLPVFEDARKQGWLIVLFASRAGAPKDLDVDCLIDNGAETGGADEAAINAIANALNAWLWICEYTAALTRTGKHPGFLKSIAAAGGDEHNQTVTPDRRKLHPCDQSIKKLALSRQYLERVRGLLGDLSGGNTREQIRNAADLIAEQIRAGKTVSMATCCHILMYEMTQNRLTPIQPFNVVWRAKSAYPKHVKADDLVLFFGYIGVRTKYEDYLTPLRTTKARFITSFIKDDRDADNNAPDAVVHIAQHWTLPDAEVEVPFPPGKIAPVSGLDQGLLYRMLEAAVAARLKGAESRK